MLKILVELRDTMPHLKLDDGKLICQSIGITSQSADIEEIMEIFYGLLIAVGYPDSIVFDGISEFVKARKHIGHSSFDIISGD